MRTGTIADLGVVKPFLAAGQKPFSDFTLHLSVEDAGDAGKRDQCKRKKLSTS